MFRELVYLGCSVLVGSVVACACWIGGAWYFGVFDDNGRQPDVTVKSDLLCDECLAPFAIEKARVDKTDDGKFRITLIDKQGITTTTMYLDGGEIGVDNRIYFLLDHVH